MAFTLDAIVTVAVSLATQPKPVEELRGLVYGMAEGMEELTAAERVWWRNPKILAGVAVAIVIVLNIIFI